jgi:hypothetical protein
MNSFKTKREQPVLVKKQVVEKLDDASHFPTLIGAKTNAPVETVVPGNLDYKKATEHINEIVELKEDLEFIPDGWVKYTVDKKTKKIMETHGPKVQSDIVEQTPEEKQEAIFDELIDALNANWVRHRKTFIKCHGEEYYNDMFLMKNYVEMECEEDQ